jgi:superfamily II DNA or RNA helicase
MNLKPFDRLYSYQKDAVEKTFTNDRGIVCMPTGVGKTFCQAAIVADDIIKNRGFNMYVVNAPRILLSYQLLKEVYGFLVNEGIEARYMFVHSGGMMDEKELELVRINSDIPFSEIGSGTSVDSIGEMMIKSKQQNLPLIFFSTYNSAERIQMSILKLNFQPISIVLNDEAHYLVQEQFHDILRTLPSPRCYFFTATMIHTPSDKGRGMNNIESYGTVLYEMLPYKAILLGKMVRPRLHFVKTDGVYNTDDYNKSLNKIISDSFKQHEIVLSKRNVLPKLLISTKGTKDILNFLNSKEYKKLREDNVEVYAVSSNQEIENQVNGVRVGRSDFLKQLKRNGEDKNKKIIVLHYDILAEGIDVSGFTGIMPLRTLNKSKFLQTFGRAARPDKEDRIKMDNKEIGVNDLDKMNKPYSYIIIPNIIHSNEDDKSNMTALIGELRTFEFKPYEDIISSSYVHGIPEIDELSGLNELQRKLPNIGILIENLQAEIEAEKDAQLSKMSLLKKIFG